MAELDTGDTAWMLASTALVLFMVPGLALFYGGMARSKSVLNMMLMSFGALFVVAILWVCTATRRRSGARTVGLVCSATSARTSA